MENREVVAQALDFLKAEGIEQGEVYFLNSTGTTIRVNDGVVEELQIREQRGLGIRVLIGGRLGFSYTTRLEAESLREAMARALTSARYTTPDEGHALPEPGMELPLVRSYDQRQGEVSIERKMEFARALEERARAYDRRILKFEHSAYIDALGEVRIANTLGLDHSYQFSRAIGYAVPVAVEGEESQSAFESDHGLSLYELSAEEIGRSAAERAIAKLGAGEYRTARVDLVLDPRVMAELFGALAPALQADNVLKGKSLFAGKLGQAIAAEVVTLIDDGTLAGGGRVAPMDGEGLPTGETVLIRQGELQGYLHNTYTARRMKACSTGNAVRFSFYQPPQVGTTNLYLQPGRESPQELLGAVAEGLYISEAMGLHTVNSISGEYSIGASGRAIHQGKLAEAVEGITIAGNVVELLQSVQAVGSDLRLFAGGGGGSTVLLEGISIGGK